MRKDIRLDRFDLKILDYLQRDGRGSFQDIGEAVGLSLSACHKRVKALEQLGVINRYAAILSARELGFRTSAYVQVTLRDQASATLQAFEAAVLETPEIMECALMSGDSDYLLRILCVDVEDYERIHSEVLTALPGVERLKSSFTLRTVCRRTAIPVNAPLDGR
ncbi:MAG: Lrp/AsnC family transcriptional regulator [Parvularculaceae bacterium]|nr:MAG: Lrp/AsnC family transcriptional regulator [Parvularculaceae bacterium]